MLISRMMQPLPALSLLLWCCTPHATSLACCGESSPSSEDAEVEAPPDVRRLDSLRAEPRFDLSFMTRSASRRSVTLRKGRSRLHSSTSSRKRAVLMAS